MLQKLKFPKIYYGWWIVLSVGIVAMIGLGFGYYGFSVLFKPLSEELGMNRALTSLAISIQLLVMGFMGPIGGISSDRFGSKWVIFIGVIWMAAFSLLMYFINSVTSFLVIWTIFCVGYSIVVTIPADKAIVTWFATKTGIALSTKFGLTSCAGFLVLPVFAWLITEAGWRLACVWMGLIIAVIGIPLILLVVKPHRPGLYDDMRHIESKASDSNQHPSGHKPIFEERSFKARDALKSSSFWLMVVITWAFNLAAPILTIHSVPFLTDRGIDPVTAAGMLALIITANIPSRVISGIIVDRIKTEYIKFIMVVGYILQTIGIAIFLLFKNEAAIYLWFILAGLGQGASLGVQFPMIARYWGRKAYGAIDGWRIAISTPIVLLGPVYVGWIYDSTGSYSSVFIQFAIILVICAVLSFFIMAPRVIKGHQAVQE